MADRTETYIYLSTPYNMDLLKKTEEMLFHAFKESHTKSYFEPSVLKIFTVNAKLIEGLMLTTDITIFF